MEHMNTTETIATTDPAPETRPSQDFAAEVERVSDAMVGLKPGAAERIASFNLVAREIG